MGLPLCATSRFYTQKMWLMVTKLQKAQALTWVSVQFKSKFQSTRKSHMGWATHTKKPALVQVAENEVFSRMSHDPGNVWLPNQAENGLQSRLHGISIRCT